MKEFILYVNLSSVSNSAEDRNLPLIQIVHEGLQSRAIGIEQLNLAILEIANREENRPEYSVFRLISPINRLLSHGVRRLLSRFMPGNILFRVEIWDGNEPGSPPIRERRRRRIRREEDLENL